MTAVLSILSRHPDWSQSRQRVVLSRNRAVQLYLRGYAYRRHDEVIDSMLDAADDYLHGGQHAQLIALYGRQINSPAHQRLRLREQRLHKILFMRMTVTGEGGSTVLAPYRALILMLDLEFGEKVGLSAMRNSLSYLGDAGLFEITRGARSHGGTSTKVSVKHLLEPVSTRSPVEAYLNLTMKPGTFDALTQFREGRRIEKGQVRAGQGHPGERAEVSGGDGGHESRSASEQLSGPDLVQRLFDAIAIEQLGLEMAEWFETAPAK